MIRLNVTAPAIVGLETSIIGYERVIAPHQSISVNIGRLKFREFASLDRITDIGINSNRKSGGISLAIDYRRYFKKRNRGFAPDGLYWAPFFTYYQYNHSLGLDYTDPSSTTTSNLDFSMEFQAYHVGVELGYQFVIKRRFTIDLILIGPSWGKYRADFDLSGNLKIDKESELYQAFSELVQDRLPGLSSLINDKKLTETGHFSTNTIGMRYLIQIGFLF